MSASEIYQNLCQSMQTLIEHLDTENGYLKSFNISMIKNLIPLKDKYINHYQDLSRSFLKVLSSTRLSVEEKENINYLSGLLHNNMHDNQNFLDYALSFNEKLLKNLTINIKSIVPAYSSSGSKRFYKRSLDNFSLKREL